MFKSDSLRYNTFWLVPYSQMKRDRPDDGVSFVIESQSEFQILPTYSNNVIKYYINEL